MSEILPANAIGIARAVALLGMGEIAGLPTETVYGLAADATNGLAVAKIYAAKGRPSFNPLICHVASVAMAETYGVFDPLSRRLAAAFWPGPLTLVVPLRENAGVSGLVTAGLATIALRMPRGVAGEIITLLGKPLAAPSANVSGRISATSAEAVNADLGASVPLILDGGPVASRAGIDDCESGGRQGIPPAPRRAGGGGDRSGAWLEAHSHGPARRN